MCEKLVVSEVLLLYLVESNVSLSPGGWLKVTSVACTLARISSGPNAR